MEVPNGYQHRNIICIYEAFGTSILIISANWGSLSGFKSVAVSYGIFAYIAIMSTVSGSNFNPAVTLGILIKGTKNSF